MPPGGKILTMNPSAISKHEPCSHPAAILPLKKRKLIESRDEEALREMPTTKKQRVGRHVSWNETKEVHEAECLYKSFPDYNEDDIWYSRREYEQFLLDRVRTVQYLRALRGNVKGLDPDFYCVRGLEPFQTADDHEELHSKRHFHQSTIIIEQMRQRCLGVRDPERYRFLVSTQSEISIRRARELAAMDEHEVYGRVSCRRQSLMTGFMPKKSSTEHVGSLDVSQQIRMLQERSARKLMELYGSGNGESLGKHFPFNLRRDSLVGSHSGAMGMFSSNNGTPTMGFPIRRDSLGTSIR